MKWSKCYSRFGWNQRPLIMLMNESSVTHKRQCHDQIIKTHAVKVCEKMVNVFSPSLRPSICIWLVFFRIIRVATDSIQLAFNPPVNLQLSEQIKMANSFFFLKNKMKINENVGDDSFDDPPSRPPQTLTRKVTDVHFVRMNEVRYSGVPALTQMARKYHTDDFCTFFLRVLMWRSCHRPPLSVFTFRATDRPPGDRIHSNLCSFDGWWREVQSCSIDAILEKKKTAVIERRFDGRATYTPSSG